MDENSRTPNDDTKFCPICCNHLPIGEFGICVARKDGRNLYCKGCIRDKVKTSRRALKEYKQIRQNYVAKQVEQDTAALEDTRTKYIPSQSPSKLSPVEKVRAAISKGASTQKEIAQKTKLGIDEIGSALVNLLLWTREVETRVVDDERVYFLRGTETKQESHALPSKKNEVPSSFSNLHGLMPGKNSGEEKEKIGGWVAA